MPQKKRPRDLNQRAKLIIDIATGETSEKPINEGKRRGGLKGGKSRADKLTPEQRAEIARTAASARWKKSN